MCYIGGSIKIKNIRLVYFVKIAFMLKVIYL